MSAVADERAAPGGEVLQDTVIGAGQPWSCAINEGDLLRIIDLRGTQAVDFLCYNADDPAERYNAPNTMKLSGSIFLTTGTRLLSSRARTLFTVVSDTCGQHDTIGGCCSAPSNRLLYGNPGRSNCRDNLLSGLAELGLGERDLVPNINWFMRVPVASDGRMAIDDGISKAGDFVDVRAEMNTLVALSNCPQIFNPANGYDPTPIRVIVTTPT